METITATENSPPKNEPEISPRQAINFSQEYLQRVYENCGIPEYITHLSLADIETKSRAEELWENVTQLAGGWIEGKSESRGLLMAGSQGSGKSTALYFSARAAIKSWLIANPPPDTKGTPIVPITVVYFKDWVRREFVTEANGRVKYNFDLMDSWLRSNAVFLDDMTFDNSSDTFRPVREFVELFVEHLCRMHTRPPLYITTNNTSAEWGTLLGSQLVDRIAGKKHGLCKIIRCNWPSFREE